MTYTLKKDLELRERSQTAFPAGVYGHLNSGTLSPAHPQFVSRAEGGRFRNTGDKAVDIAMDSEAFHLFYIGVLSLQSGFAEGQINGNNAKAQSFFQLFDWPRRSKNQVATGL